MFLLSTKLKKLLYIHDNTVKKMRHNLLQWMNRVYEYFGMDPIVYDYGVLLFDKFEENCSFEFDRVDYYLVGCVIFNLANKFLDDEQEIPIIEWCDLLNGSCTKEDFLTTEFFVLDVLCYNLNI